MDLPISSFITVAYICYSRNWLHSRTVKSSKKSILPIKRRRQLMGTCYYC